MKRASGLWVGLAAVCALGLAMAWAGEKSGLGGLAGKIGKVADDAAKETGKAADATAKEADKLHGDAQERWQKMREQRMTQIRETLGVSDEQWAKIRPLIDKLDQYARVRETLAMMPVMRGRRLEGSKAPEMTADRMTEHVMTRCSNVERELVTEIVTAQKALSDAVADDTTNDAELTNATDKLRAACAKLDAKADETRKALAAMLNPRQQAALLLQGVLK